MALTLVLSPVVVPGLIPIGRPLPSVLQNSVDQRFTDQDAQVHYEEGIHRPAEGEGERVCIKKGEFQLTSSKNDFQSCSEMSWEIHHTFPQQSASEI